MDIEVTAARQATSTPWRHCGRPWRRQRRGRWCVVLAAGLGGVAEGVGRGFSVLWDGNARAMSG
jgi:hypothetical protein